MFSIKSEAVNSTVKEEPNHQGFIILQPQLDLIPKSKIKEEKILIENSTDKIFKAKNLHPNKFTCPKCDKRFKFKSPLEAHLILCGKKTFDCNHCKKKFVKKHSLDVHSCTKCSHCSKIFYSKYETEKHINSVHTEKSRQIFYECDFCGKKILYRTSFQRHLIVKHVKTNDIFYCDNCPLTFSTIQAIKSHMRKHVSLVECEICGKKLNSYNSIYTHMKMMHGENPRKFQCQKCPSKFKSKSKLIRHLFVHENLVCNINNCGLKFSEKGSYLYHVKSHEDPKLLTCKICNKIMKTKSTLELHMTQIHGKGKELNLKCHRCDYKTYSKGHLNSHFKVHTNYDEKLKRNPNFYQCDKCPFSLIKTKSSLIFHMKSKHDQSASKCDVCNKVFKWKPNFKRHKCFK